MPAGRLADALRALSALPDTDGLPGDVDLPFPYDRTAKLPPGRLDEGDWARWRVGVLDLPFEGLRATQFTVSREGVAGYLRDRGRSPVVVVRQRDGRLAVADGHHRLMADYLRGEAAVRAELYDVPAPDPAARRR